MAQRYILCGVTTEVNEYGETERVAAIAKMNWPPGTEITYLHHPSEDKAFCLVTHPTNVLPIPGNIDAEALPEHALDTKVGAMHGPTRIKMRDNLQKRGIDDSVVDNADGYREVIRHVGKQFDPQFHENTFGLQG
jgi:hypothetical protein